MTSFSPKCFALLESGLPNARFIDADRLVNWARVVKSPAEIEVMEQAAQIADAAHGRAREVVMTGMSSVPSSDTGSAGGSLNIGLGGSYSVGISK